MTKKERIINNIKNSDLARHIEKISYFDEEAFYEHGTRWVKAIKEGRMLCSIEQVSKSGMSRDIKFMECAKHTGKNEYSYLNFWSFMKANGYKEARNSNAFRIGGCGMDMVFHTNYTIIHRLERLGFISKKECEVLAQKTPTIV